MELIKITQYHNIPVVDSRDIAQELGIKHKNLLETIDKHQATIESMFGRVAFETEPLPTAGGIQKSTVAYLTEDQAIFIGTLSRNSEQVVKFKARLVQSFQQMRKLQQPQNLPAKSPSELNLMIAEQNLANEQRINQLEAGQAQMEAKLTTSNADYYTIMGYGNLIKKTISYQQAQVYGIQATALSHKLGHAIDKVPDPRFGKVNAYSALVLRQIIF